MLECFNKAKTLKALNSYSFRIYLGKQVLSHLRKTVILRVKTLPNFRRVVFLPH